MARLSSFTPEYSPIEADSGKLEPLALPPSEAHWGAIAASGWRGEWTKDYPDQPLWYNNKSAPQSFYHQCGGDYYLRKHSKEAILSIGGKQQEYFTPTELFHILKSFFGLDEEKVKSHPSPTLCGCFFWHAAHPLLTRAIVKLQLAYEPNIPALSVYKILCFLVSGGLWPREEKPTTAKEKFEQASAPPGLTEPTGPPPTEKPLSKQPMPAHTLRMALSHLTTNGRPADFHDLAKLSNRTKR